MAAMKHALILAALLAAAPALGSGDRDHDRDHDRARDALRRGEAQSLSAILPQVEAQFGARVIEVEFERRHGRHVYEFELITPDGRIIEAVVDAGTGEILRSGAEGE